MLDFKMKNSSPVFDDEAAMRYLDNNKETFLERLKRLVRDRSAR